MVLLYWAIMALIHLVKLNSTVRVLGPKFGSKEQSVSYSAKIKGESF